LALQAPHCGGYNPHRGGVPAAKVGYPTVGSILGKMGSRGRVSTRILSILSISSPNPSVSRVRVASDDSNLSYLPLTRARSSVRVSNLLRFSPNSAFPVRLSPRSYQIRGHLLQHSTLDTNEPTPK
jgi:hypothetical protein